MKSETVILLPLLPCPFEKEPKPRKKLPINKGDHENNKKKEEISLL